MIKKSEMNDDSIEKWCQMFQSLPVDQLTDMSSELYVKILLNLNFYDTNKDFLEFIQKEFAYQVITKRVKVFHDYEIKPSAIAVIQSWFGSSPGTLVMVMNYIQYWCKKHNFWTVDANTLGFIFMLGIPSQENLQKAWDAQKCEKGRYLESDNLLDHIECSKSIRK